MAIRKRRRRRFTPSRIPYGPEYTRDRKDLFAAFIEGSRCPYADCPYPGRRMYHSQGLQAGHVIARMIGGGFGPLRVEHAKCNARHGARLGNAARSRRAQLAGAKAAAKRAARRSKW
jgi:hypothetical protein